MNEQQILSAFQQTQIRQILAKNGPAAIVCHMTPDGDALGSSLCLYHTLRAAGFKAIVVVPDMPPSLLTSALPGAKEIVVASCQAERAAKILKSACVIWCLDFNDLRRIDRLANAVSTSKASKILIDHHLNPSVDADVVISRPDQSSTCVLLYQVLREIGLSDNIIPDAATCCCAGMMTDTGNFSFNANSPELYRAMSELIERGVDKDALTIKLFGIKPERSIRLMAYCQYEKMRLYPEHQAAVITLSREELNRFDYHKGDTEGLVNIPLDIPGVTYSVYLREDEPDYVKVSMRSRGDFSVKAICEDHFGGGGHLNAAGGELRTSLDEALRVLMDVMPLYDKHLPQT